MSTAIKQPETGLSRLFSFLGHVDEFPIPLIPAAIVAGISEQDVVLALEGTPFAVVGDLIVSREEQERLGGMYVGLADFLYVTRGTIMPCADGLPICQFGD